MREITWQTLEYQHKEHSVDWFWGVGIITVGAAIVSIIFNNILFALFIVVGGIAVVVMSLRDPHMITYSINERGVKVGTDLYLYNSLESFWIQMEYGSPKLLIKSGKKLMPLLIIPLDDANIEAVQDFLVDYLPEEELHEPLAHHIFDLLGY